MRTSKQIPEPEHWGKPIPTMILTRISSQFRKRRNRYDPESLICTRICVAGLLTMAKGSAGRFGGLCNMRRCSISEPTKEAITKYICI